MNARKEYLKLIANKSPVLCAEIYYRNCWNHELTTDHLLKHSYTEEEYKAFSESLDFDYDAGFGGQELYGTIWFKDGTWADRGGYDGSEWWQYNICPIVPKKLLF